MYSCLSGGLGNQMFQYAAAYIIKQYTPGAEIIIDDSYYHFQPKADTVRKLEIEQFSIKYDRFTSAREKKAINTLRKMNKLPWPSDVSKFISTLLCGKFSLTDKEVYSLKPLRNSEKACLLSFYQNADFLNLHRDILLPLFEIRNDIRLKCEGMDVFSFIKKTDNVTALHIRRGDYVTNPHAAKYHGVLPLEYYTSAMLHIEKKLGKQHFVIFSDDPDWVRETFSQYENCYVVNNIENEHSAIDIYLMSLCDNIIIANSTYSWWGAWLNKSESKVVITPERWFLAEDKNSLKHNDWISI
ncbi:alpha-1,2-fucosyltransferase [Kluyvera sichuanensis]|uniref:alpha-1,2-fucosyltransferase n=1 Tax=Kluyvera sichuanensis TaxID=2725494 RepID=UPI0039F4C6AE